VIELERVSKRYHQPGGNDFLAIDDISFRVARGEILVMIGASGCGKTTTLKTINRLVDPSSGCVRISGRDTREQAPHELRRRIGYGFQGVGLFPHLSVGENIAITPRLLGWSDSRIAARVDHLLESVQLEPTEFRERMPAGLSGGQQQRVGLARALAAEQELLLLDEPFGALDPPTRDHLQQTLLRIRRELELTIVFVTHDMSEALLLADHIAVLDAGRLVQLGTPHELVQRPAHGLVRELLDAPTRQARAIDALFAAPQGSA
jgi:osmoprotectant transport system ATP-binding protein